MPIKEAKALYYAMLDSGDLLELYPNLTGDWNEDEGQFLRDYELNNRMMDGEDGVFDSPFDNEFDY